MDHDLQTLLAALGPLAGLYEDPGVREIMVDSTERVLVEREGSLQVAGVKFDSPEAVRAVIEALLAVGGRTIQPGETVLTVRLPGSEARGVAVLPPTAPGGPCLTLRKPHNTGWLTWEKLIEFGSITREAVRFLEKSVQASANILIAGGTASGKTTVANRVAELIPPEQRVVIVEDLHALQVNHPRAVYLEAAGQAGVTFSDLITTGSLMRPDWLVIGELNGPEAMRAMEILGRGYSGITLMHANSLEDAVARLEAMCLTANLGLGLAEIRGLIAAAIRLVCYLKYLPGGKRKLVEIAELRSGEDGRLILERLFRYNPDAGLLEPTAIKASWEEISF